MCKTYSRITTLTYLVFIVFSLSGCKIATDLAGGLGNNLSGGGAKTSLSGNQNDFDDIGSDFSGDDGSKNFAKLDQHFSKVGSLSNSKTDIPANVSYSYFKVVDTFYKNVDSSNVNDRDENGKTPLQAAIEKNDVAMVRFLVKQGANVDSASMSAARQAGNSFIIRVLENKE